MKMKLSLHICTPLTCSDWSTGFTSPLQKRKLSWLDPDHTSEVPTKHNNHQCGKNVSSHAESSLDTTCLPGSPKKRKTQEEETVGPAGDSCTVGHEFTDRTCTSSRPTCLCAERENENQERHEYSPPSSCGSISTQDSSVSSSNTSTRSDSP